MQGRAPPGRRPRARLVGRRCVAGTAGWCSASGHSSDPRASPPDVVLPPGPPSPAPGWWPLVPWGSKGDSPLRPVARPPRGAPVGRRGGGAGAGGGHGEGAGRRRRWHGARRGPAGGHGGANEPGGWAGVCPGGCVGGWVGGAWRPVGRSGGRPPRAAPAERGEQVVVGAAADRLHLARVHHAVGARFTSPLGVLRAIPSSAPMAGLGGGNLPRPAARRRPGRGRRARSGPGTNGGAVAGPGERRRAARCRAPAPASSRPGSRVRQGRPAGPALRVRDPRSGGGPGGGPPRAGAGGHTSWRARGCRRTAGRCRW